jgi:iron complex outermembrane receptor protein
MTGCRYSILWLKALTILVLMPALPTRAQLPPDQQLGELDLEELANLRVTSVSHRSEPLADAAASIVVITGDEIRRSGVTSLPEALRLAPNLHVAREDVATYAIAARGFNSAIANKLLVTVDGRSVFNTVSGGVYWDTQHMILEDIDRIEVVSGPGATMWGTNAVNGVINIITKSAAHTQGTLATVGAGTNDDRYHAVRYGGMLANGGYYRVYGMDARYLTAQGRVVQFPLLVSRERMRMRQWRTQHVGFRTDWGHAARNFTFQGDAHRGNLDQGVSGRPGADITGANLVGRMNTTLEGGSNLSVQAYFDYADRNGTGLPSFTSPLTLDLQLHHALRLASIHEVVWGAGYRRTRDDQDPGVPDSVRAQFPLFVDSRNTYWGNVFVQDEIALRENLRLTAGIRLEQNHYTGLEYLPNLRLAWKPRQNNLIWSSISRAVHTPDRRFGDTLEPRIIPSTGQVQFFSEGNPDLQSEVAKVFEVGYRAQPAPTLSYSATAYFAHYEKLTSGQPASTPLAFVVFTNDGEGRGRGIEMSGTWQALPSWRLAAGLTVRRLKTWLNASSRPESLPAQPATSSHTDPSNFWTLRSSYDIAQGHALDLTVRHSGKFKPSVPRSYTTMDVRYGWKIRRDLELSVAGLNLADQWHREFGMTSPPPEIERSLFVKLTWQY